MNSMYMRHFTGLITVILAIILVILSAAGLGCQEEEPEQEQPSPLSLSSTLVPDVDFDVYVYIKQEAPTPVVKDIIGVPHDVNVSSLAIWGIAGEVSYAVSGALSFVSPGEASEVYDQIPEGVDIWTSISEQAIYFIHGSGVAAETFKAALSANRMKTYDNQDAFDELSLFPENDEMKLIGVVVAEPGTTLAGLVTKYTTPESADILNALLATADLKIATAGLYSPGQIDIAEITRDPSLDTILELETGILISVKSGWSGFLLGPIVGEVLENAGYTRDELDGFSVYRGIIEPEANMKIPLYFRIEGNNFYIAVSLQDSYARMLVSNIGK